MSGNLKTAGILALLFAVIFGVAVISSSTPPPKDKPQVDPTIEIIPPLVADATVYRYDPKKTAADPDYYHQFFSGFFEVGTGGENATARNWVPFVVRNHRTEPVRVMAGQPSCSKCTSARGAIISPAALDEFTRTSAVADLLTMGGMPNPLSALLWADVYSKLTWSYFTFNDAKSTLTIPAAASKTEPQYAIIELDFRISHIGPPSDVTGNFELMNTKGERLQSAPVKLVVNYASMEAFGVWPNTITAGEFPEGVSPQTFQLYAYSMTRDSMPPPKTLVNDNDGTFVAGTPEPLNAEERVKLAAWLAVELKDRVRVRSAWRVPITIRRTVPGGPPVEVGDFDREVHVADPEISSVTYRCIVKGSMTGAVKIDGATKLELGDYQSMYGVKKEFMLVSDNLQLDLQLQPERCSPKFVQMALSPPRDENGRRQWKLTLSIPPNSGNKPPFNGHAVVSTTGPNATIFRFAVSGHGR